MISTREDALEILGFRENASPTEDELKKAYRQHALRTHPDKIKYPDGATQAQKSKLLAETNAAFIAVGESYTLLSKPISQQPRRPGIRNQQGSKSQSAPQNRGYKRTHSNPDLEFTLDDAIALYNSLSTAGKIGVAAAGFVGLSLYLYSTYKELTTGKSLLASILEPDEEPEKHQNKKAKKS
ncbi:MAG: DnaJ domain-containing protein [Candidatus Berkiella sp.]